MMRLLMKIKNSRNRYNPLKLRKKPRLIHIFKIYNKIMNKKITWENHDYNNLEMK